MHLSQQCLLIRSDSSIKLSLHKLKIHKETFLQILKIGIPSGVQSAVFSFANIIIQSAVNSLGTIIMAASSAAYNIEILVYYVTSSFGQACTTFVGQNSGANEIGRCKKTLKICIFENFICLSLSVALVLIFGRTILSIFNTNPEVIENGYMRLVFIFIAYIFSMLYENTAGYLRGFRISLLPALITTVCVCGIRIFWIYCIFPSSPSFRTIMTAYPISLAATALFMFIALVCIKPAKKQV